MESGEYGLWVQTDSTNAVIDNCMATAGIYDDYLDQGANTTATACHWGAHDADFVSAATQNFRIGASSDAIDQGKTLDSLVILDWDGNTRSGTCDLGAYEYGGSPPAPPGTTTNITNLKGKGKLGGHWRR